MMAAAVSLEARVPLFQAKKGGRRALQTEGRTSREAPGHEQAQCVSGNVIVWNCQKVTYTGACVWR